jgi:hypothetical protein
MAKINITSADLHTSTLAAETMTLAPASAAAPEVKENTNMNTNANNSKYDYSATEIVVIEAKLPNHCSTLARILLGKQSAHGLHQAEELLLAAVKACTYSLEGGVKIESAEMMDRKVLDHSMTISRMLMVKSYLYAWSMTPEQTALAELLKPILVGKNGYTPR